MAKAVTVRETTETTTVISERTTTATRSSVTEIRMVASLTLIEMAEQRTTTESLLQTI